MSKDITNLGGDDLWAALSSGEKITAKSKPKPQAKAQTSTQRTSATLRDRAIVLLIHKTYCDTCGGVYENPNPTLFVKRVHPSNSTVHWQGLDQLPNAAENLKATLPFETAYTSHHVTDCARCFGIEKLLQGQAIADSRDVPEGLIPPPKVEYTGGLGVDCPLDQGGSATEAQQPAPVAEGLPIAAATTSPLVEDEDTSNQQMEA